MQGCILLTHVTSVAPLEGSDDHIFVLKFEGQGEKGDRDYILRAKTATDMQEWLDALKDSIEYYKKNKEDSPIVPVCPPPLLKQDSNGSRERGCMG